MDLDIVKRDLALENKSDKVWLTANLSADRLDYSLALPFKHHWKKKKKTVSGAYGKKMESEEVFKRALFIAL